MTFAKLTLQERYTIVYESGKTAKELEEEYPLTEPDF